jgi:uncharacterized protein YuzE
VDGYGEVNGIELWNESEGFWSEYIVMHTREVNGVVWMDEARKGKSRWTLADLESFIESAHRFS